MNPDIASAVRALLIAGGTALLIAPGWLTTPQLEQGVGGIIALISVVWSWWANRSKSSEAQTIAQKVADDPEVPGPVIPPDVPPTAPTEGGFPPPPGA